MALPLLSLHSFDSSAATGVFPGVIILPPCLCPLHPDEGQQMAGDPTGQGCGGREAWVFSGH